MKSTIQRHIYIKPRLIISAGAELVDCNDALDPTCTYQVESTALNSPAPYCEMILFTTAWGMVQVAFRYNGDGVYYRALGNNIWSEWKRVTTV